MSNQTGKTKSSSQNNYRLAEGRQVGIARRGILAHAKKYLIILNTPIDGIKEVEFYGKAVLTFFKQQFKTLDKANVMARCSLIEL